MIRPPEVPGNETPAPSAAVEAAASANASASASASSNAATMKAYDKRHANQPIPEFELENQEDHLIPLSKLVHAAEVLLCITVGLVAGVTGAHYVITPGPLLEGPLNAMHSLCVDMVAFLFVLKGASFASYYNTRDPADSHAANCVALLRRTVPDLAVSALPWFAILACTSPGVAVYWVNLALTPFCLSPFAEFRASTSFRAVNETTWVAQTLVLFFVFGEVLCAAFQRSLPTLSGERVRWVLAVSWALGFVHIYIALCHPQFSTSAMRSPFTSLTFFSQGIIAYHATTNHVVFSVFHEFRKAVGRYALCIAAFAVLFYVRHMDPSAVTVPRPGGSCFQMMGGTPCMWTVDACNLRLLPLLVLCVACLFCERNWISSSGDAKLTKFMYSAVCRAEDMHSACAVFLLYPVPFAFVLHSPVAWFAPEFARGWVFTLLLLEIGTVFAACLAWNRFISDRLQRFLPSLMPVQQGLEVMYHWTNSVPMQTM